MLFCSIRLTSRRHWNPLTFCRMLILIWTWNRTYLSCIPKPSLSGVSQVTCVLTPNHFWSHSVRNLFYLYLNKTIWRGFVQGSKTNYLFVIYLLRKTNDNLRHRKTCIKPYYPFLYTYTLLLKTTIRLLIE